LLSSSVVFGDAINSVVDDIVPVKYIILYEMRIIGTKLSAILIFHVLINLKQIN